MTKDDVLKWLADKAEEYRQPSDNGNSDDRFGDGMTYAMIRAAIAIIKELKDE